jgi:hypothetical protein
MKLQILGANRTQVTFPTGVQVFFSYETAVAAFVPGRGYLRTEKHYSRTTSKHIGQWCDAKAATVVPQNEIDALAN